MIWVAFALANAALTAADPNVTKRADGTTEYTLQRNGRPTFISATDSWACSFIGFGTSEIVTRYFGVYGSRLSDDTVGSYSIIQNDTDVLIASESSFGIKDVKGDTIKSVMIIMIDKSTMKYKQSNVNVDKKSDEVSGRCQRY